MSFMVVIVFVVVSVVVSVVSVVTIVSAEPSEPIVSVESIVSVIPIIIAFGAITAMSLSENWSVMGFTCLFVSQKRIEQVQQDKLSFWLGSDHQ